MRAIEYGIEGMVAEDRAYSGSRFKEVRDAVFATPYPGIWDADGRMPMYEVTLKRILGGILPFGQPFHFRDATARTVDSFADLRWGPDRKRLSQVAPMCWLVAETDRNKTSCGPVAVAHGNTGRHLPWKIRKRRRPRCYLRYFLSKITLLPTSPPPAPDPFGWG